MSYTRVEEVGSDDDGCPALTSVAMDKDLVPSLRATLDYDVMNQLANFHRHFVLWSFQVFPVQIEVLDTVVHQKFGRVTEPSFRINSIATVGMFAWLFEIEDGHYVVILELLDDIELPDESVTGPLRPDEQVMHPL